MNTRLVTLLLTFCALHSVLGAEPPPYGLRQDPDGTFSVGPSSLTPLPDQVSRVAAPGDVRYHPPHETLRPPAEIASLVSSLGSRLTRRNVEEKLGREWYEVPVGSDGSGDVAGYFNPAYPGFGIQALYDRNDARVIQGEGGGTFPFAGPRAPLLAPAVAVKMKRPPPREVLLMVQAAPLWRILERISLLERGAMSFEKQFDAGQWASLFAEMGVVLLPLLGGLIWRRNWHGVPLGMLVASPVAVIAGWITGLHFQVRLLEDLGINYFQSVGDTMYDGVGSNVVSLFFGWVPPAMECATVIGFVFLWHQFRPRLWFQKLAERLGNGAMA